MIQGSSISQVDLIIDYLENGTQPQDRGEAQKFRLKVAKYTMKEEELLRRLFNEPLMQYVEERDQKYVLQQIHIGVCDNHTCRRSLTHCIFTVGYQWPYSMKSVKDFTRRCEKCQKHAPTIQQPSKMLNSVVSPWPLARWGLDIIRKLPIDKRGNCFILVETNYITNWVEAETYTKNTQNNVITFIWKQIICSFCIPRALIMDNETQFNNPNVSELCEQYGIMINFSLVYYPQANGMGEATNKVFIISNATQKKRRMKELLKILWAQRQSYPS